MIENTMKNKPQLYYNIYSLQWRILTEVTTYNTVIQNCKLHSSTVVNSFNRIFFLI